MDKLIKTLPALLQASGDSEEVAEAACKAAWKHAVGEGLSSHAIPLQLQNKTLVVVVEDNIWKTQLERMRGSLLFRLNSALGRAFVKSIELRIDPKTLLNLRGPEERKHSRRSYLTDEIPAEILAAAGAIQDVELRRAFLGAATSCLSRQENAEAEF